MMGWLQVADDIIFDSTNEEGRIIHRSSGECWELNQIATIILEAGLQYPSRAETVSYLSTRIDAPHEQIEEYLGILIKQLGSLVTAHSEQESAVTLPPHDNAPTPERERICPDYPFKEQEDQPQDAQPDRIDWETWLTGKLVNAPLPPLSCIQRGYALSQTFLLLLLLGVYRLAACLTRFLPKVVEQTRQKKEWSAIRWYLRSIRGFPTVPVQGLDRTTMTRLARRELNYCQLLFRLLVPNGACFTRSITFCAYLRALDLTAQVIVGRSRFSKVDHYTYHAWVELAGAVVNDLTEVQTGYTAVLQIPNKGKDLNHFTSASPTWSK